jgi:hypothetical protein
VYPFGNSQSYWRMRSQIINIRARHVTGRVATSRNLDHIGVVQATARPHEPCHEWGHPGVVLRCGKALHRDEVPRGYGNLCGDAWIMRVEAIGGNWSAMRTESGAGVI